MAWSRGLPHRVSKCPTLGSNEYLFNTTYYQHKRYAHYRWNSLAVSDSNNKQQDLILVGYFFRGKEHAISPDRQGNAKNDFKYIPTAVSTKEQIASALLSNVREPNTICDSVSEEIGGVENAYAVSDMPRNTNQVSYA